ncbi:MAG TPA: S53 family peptidase [Candidatus Sulfotelmatobacter sp.]|nr:S53 family peptidase [Candidatus Sulfotelmatobacter sp.]
MHKLILLIAIAAAAAFSAAQDDSNVLIPESSIERPGDAGVRMHTNYFMRVPDPNITPDAPPPGLTVETPGSMACIYNLVSPHVAGCPVHTATTVPSGGSQLIVIVDAFDYPGAAADLTTFDHRWGLPATTFIKRFATGHQPTNGCASGWEGEESLDIQWAHAMAPKATIVLMEAASNSVADLTSAVQAANTYIKNHGGKGEISMSWGGPEFNGEQSYDPAFTAPNVVYLASSGDTAGVIYPSSSPNVISVGGTQVNRNSSGDYTGQTASSKCDPTAQGCGGGKSAFETRPSYQNGVVNFTGNVRGTPDIASDSSSSSPVWVYNSSCYNSWVQVYGTSVAAPTLAGIINRAGSFKANTNAELTEIYNNRHQTTAYTDITAGSCTTHTAKTGYDLCTGVGVAKGYGKK